MIGRLRSGRAAAEESPTTDDFDRQLEVFRSQWAPSRIAILRAELECPTCEGLFEVRLLLAFRLGRKSIGGPVKARRWPG